MLISICIAAYNRPAFLQQAVQSVLDQCDPCYEVVITDDSSDAEVERLVAGHWSSVPAVRYFRNAHRLGYPNNFNRALAESAGLWIVTLADDDYLLPGALATVRAASDILGGPGMIFPGQPCPADRRDRGIAFRYYPAGAALQEFGGRPPSTVFFSRELFERWGGYDDRYLASDEELWARYLQSSACIEVTSHALAHYRLHQDNLGLQYLDLPNSLSQYDAVSHRLAVYRGLSGSELEEFMLARRRKAIRFGIGRGLQLRNAELIRRYATLMRTATAEHSCSYAFMARVPQAAAAAYTVYRWLRKSLRLPPLFA
jgi:glycosyltransferase involved in cell wall biosynthesis